MEGHDGPIEPDPDDWFSEPDVSVATGDRAPTATPAVADADDWLGDAATPSRRRRRSRRGPTDPRIWIAAGLGLVILLIVGLAIGGAFNSGSGGGTTALFTLTSPAATVTTTTTTPSKHTVVVVPGAPLKPGDTGAQVKLLQLALNHLGYPVGKVDGVYGPGTTQAVKNFQTAKGLTADGVCGPQTIAALSTALKA